MSKERNLVVIHASAWYKFRPVHQEGSLCHPMSSIFICTILSRSSKVRLEL